MLCSDLRLVRDPRRVTALYLFGKPNDQQTALEVRTTSTGPGTCSQPRRHGSIEVLQAASQHVHLNCIVVAGLELTGSYEAIFDV